MPNTDSDEELSPARLEQKRIGQALRQLRLRKGLNQATAAERFEVSTQAWQRYEAGERRFPEWKLAKLATAAGGTLEELMLERSRIGEDGDRVISLADRRRAFAPPERSGAVASEVSSLIGPMADRMRLNTGALSPWAEIGELIVFDRERPPRRSHGCVIDHADGSQSVALFEGHTGREWKVYTLSPEREDITIPADQVRGIYAVRLRGD